MAHPRPLEECKADFKKLKDDLEYDARNLVDLCIPYVQLIPLKNNQTKVVLEESERNLENQEFKKK